MRATQNPILYALAHEPARRLIEQVAAIDPVPYEAARKALGVDAETFHRITRKLAQFDLIRLRPARRGEFENGRIKVVIAESPATKSFIRGLSHVERAMWKHRDLLGARSVAALQGSG